MSTFDDYRELNRVMEELRDYQASRFTLADVLFLVYVDRQLSEYEGLPASNAATVLLEAVDNISTRLKAGNIA